MTAVTQPGSLGEQKPTEPMTVHTVRGGGGLRLHVRQWGRADGPPILLIHGISGSHLCWGQAAFGTLIGPGFLDHFADFTADDLPTNIRANLGARELDGDDVLRALRVPLLVSQGRADTVVLPAMAEHVLATCPAAEASWYDGVGHTPHLEAPERLNRELAALARRVSSSNSAQ